MKYRLKTAHISKEGHVIAAGTIVGDGEPFPAPDPPTPDMEPIDNKAKSRFAEEFEWDVMNSRFARRR